MGLTIAETFMLVSFALLLLFLFWRLDLQERQELRGQIEGSELEEIGSSEVERLRRIFESESFSEDDLTLLRNLYAQDSENGLNEFRNLARSGNMQPLAICLARPPEEMNERWRLLDESIVRQLAETAVNMPERQKRTLQTLIETKDLAGLAAECTGFQEIVGEGRTASEVRDALEVSDALVSAGESDSEDLKSRIRSRLVSEVEGQQRIVSDLVRVLGVYVSEVGGQIRDDGAIVLPNSITFARASAQLTQQMREFLGRACDPWIKVLESSGLDIEEIRFEGHSSPEWSGAASEAEAFMLNLELSQRRAQAALSECLDIVGDVDRQAWARKRMTAVGFSSSRPIVVEGREDLPQSRRVVFSYSTSTKRLLEDIENVVEE